MRKLRNVFMMSALAMTFAFASKCDVSAKTTSVKPLKANKTYEYNLDQKGAKEKVKVVQKQVSTDDYDYTSMTLYINNKAVVSKVKDGAVFVMDTNKKDKQMEVLIAKGFQNDSWTDNLCDATYYRYTSGKLKKVQNLGSVAKKKYKKLAWIHYVTDHAAFKVDSKGNLTYRVCLSLDKGLDYIHFDDTMKLKNGKFVTSSKKSFSLKDEGTGTYRSKGTNKVYKTPGSSKVAFTLKDKGVFYKKGVYIKNNSTYYVKIKAKKTGKTGYIKNKSFKAYMDGTMHM